MNYLNNNKHIYLISLNNYKEINNMISESNNYIFSYMDKNIDCINQKQNNCGSRISNIFPQNTWKNIQNMRNNSFQKNIYLH